MGTALLLVACEPLTPRTDVAPCGDLPSCSSLEYKVDISGTGTSPADTNSGHYQINQLGFRLLITPVPVLPRSSCLPSARPGFAYASSCLPCTGESLLQVDSLYFTTDILLPTNNTIEAGRNFKDPPWKFWLQGEGPFYSSVLQNSGARFRDSVFEVRFSGTIDSIRKTGSATLHITNPALLFP